MLQANVSGQPLQIEGILHEKATTGIYGDHRCSRFVPLTLSSLFVVVRVRHDAVSLIV
jgi:hypothetical protein